MRKTLLLLTIATLVFASCGKEEVRPEPIPDGNLVLNCEKPAYLSDGDTVALISPAYYTPMENVEATANVLRSWGLVPVIGPNVGKIVDGKYAGTVDERASDILWAFNDPSIKAIICNRGGYGTIQLIDHIPLAELSASPKWLVGFSDISTLHGLLSRAGVMSVHGTMSSYLANGGTAETSTMMRDLLNGAGPLLSPARPRPEHHRSGKRRAGGRQPLHFRSQPGLAGRRHDGAGPDPLCRGGRRVDAQHRPSDAHPADERRA